MARWVPDTDKLAVLAERNASRLQAGWLGFRPVELSVLVRVDMTSPGRAEPGARRSPARRGASPKSGPVGRLVTEHVKDALSRPPAHLRRPDASTEVRG